MATSSRKVIYHRRCPIVQSLSNCPIVGDNSLFQNMCGSKTVEWSKHLNIMCLSKQTFVSVWGGQSNGPAEGVGGHRELVLHVLDDTIHLRPGLEGHQFPPEVLAVSLVLHPWGGVLGHQIPTALHPRGAAQTPKVWLTDVVPILGKAWVK